MSVISNLVSTVASGTSPIVMDGLAKSVTSVDAGGASIGCTISTGGTNDSFQLKFALKPGQTIDVRKWNLRGAELQLSYDSSTFGNGPAVLYRCYQDF